MTDANGRAISADGSFGTSTRAAVENFQATYGMTVDGIVGKRTEDAINHQVERARHDTLMSISDARHPGVSLYNQALEGVRLVDQERGRTSDQASCHLAGSLAVAACMAGFSRVDHVVMSDDGARAYAVQGALNSPFKQYTDVDVTRSVTVPLEQSGSNYLQADQERGQQQSTQQQQQVQSQDAVTQQPAMYR
jgi:peptidoglycan hydrolase-like protein with peptidoglycan-binding domain